MNEREEYYRINLRLIGFEIRKELLNKKEITIKVSANQKTPDDFNFPGDFKESVTIPVEKCENANQMFNVNVKNPDPIRISFKTKDKLRVKHKIAFANIDYQNFIQMLKKDEKDNLNRKGNYVFDKIQKIPIYQFYKSKLNKYYVKYDGETIVGYMKFKLSLFQFHNDYTHDPNSTKSCNFINDKKDISIDMHKFNNYHLSKREKSDYQGSNKPYQLKKQFQNLL